MKWSVQRRSTLSEAGVENGGDKAPNGPFAYGGMSKLSFGVRLEKIEESSFLAKYNVRAHCASEVAKIFWFGGHPNHVLCR